MRRITPHLWFDREAVEAAEFYCSALPDSKITDVTTIHGTPSGDTDVVSFELCRQPFAAISAGPLFQFNPSVSFVLNCTTGEEVDVQWTTLAEGRHRSDAAGLLPLQRPLRVDRGPVRAVLAGHARR